jgi:hypothetical protein
MTNHVLFAMSKLSKVQVLEMMLREKIMCTAPLLFFNLTIKFFFKFPAEFWGKILCVDSKWHYQATHKIFSKNSAGNLKKNLIVRLKKSNGAVYMIFSGNFISNTCGVN